MLEARWIEKAGHLLGHGTLEHHEAQGRRILYVARLQLSSDAARNIVAGQAPFELFRGATGPQGPCSMVWGDVELYETGRPSIKDFVAIQGLLDGVPPPALVSAVVQWLQARHQAPNPP